jgi:hypothetical protein
MAERKKSESKLEAAQQKVERLEKEEQAPSALSDPWTPDEPSPVRHWIYLAWTILGGLVLNLVVLVVLAGPSGG